MWGDVGQKGEERDQEGVQKNEENWEDNWWKNVVEEAKKAEISGDLRILYKTLRRIGIRDSNSCIEDE